MPGKPLPQHLRARVLVLSGDLAGARASYEKALTADAKYFASIEGLATIDRSKASRTGARTVCAVLKANPDDVRP